MTDEERYLFDLNGYLVVRGALAADEMDALDAALERVDVWAEAARRPQTVHNNALKTHLGPVRDWGPEFLALATHPVVLGYLRELLGPGLRLDHEYAIYMREGADGLPMHGGGTPYDPAQYYHYRDGRLHNGLTVVALSLGEVAPGDGGFCCVPGSHKANLRLPEGFRNPERGQPWLVQPALSRGDLVIFTEALTHGTLSWRAPRERRSLLYKYAPAHLSWGHPERTIPEDADETVRRILDLPYIWQRKPV